MWASAELCGRIWKIVAHSLVDGRRNLDITVTLRSVGGAEVEIGGTHELNKGYRGALEVRFAPRTDTRINTAAQEDTPDSDRVPAAWAELAGNFGGKITSTRVTEDPSNPGAPNGWCLRHYGFVGVEYPGLQLRRLVSEAPLTMKFRASLWGSSTSANLPDKHVLVYPHNGKGYVHDNIQASVDAIKLMGAENGFTVEAMDDPAIFADQTLKR